MIEFHGMCIPTTLEELVDPRYTAVVVVDVQNDFCLKEGVFSKLGKPLLRGDTIVRNLKLLIEEARRSKVQIAYIQNSRLPNRMDDSAARLCWQMIQRRVNDPQLVPQVTLEGSWGQQMVEDIKPRDGDIVVKKHRSSGFVGTSLDMLLRAKDIKTLLITGLNTEHCVLATATFGHQFDFFVVLLSDCVDSNSKDHHDAAMKVMEVRCHYVTTSDQIIEIWRKEVR